MIYYKTETGTLYLEDILNKDTIENDSVDLIVTSPPYNLSIEYENHDDDMPYGDYLKWCSQWLENCYDWLKPLGRICINIPMKITMPSIRDINQPLEADYIKLLQSVGFKYNNTIIWNKGNIVKTCWGSFKSASAPFIRDNIEAIIICYKDQWKKEKGESDISPTEFVKWTQTLWTFSSSKDKTHPAAFPKELPMRCIKCFSYINDVILDPFAGTGTTCKAANEAGRKWIGIDNSEKYLSGAKTKIDSYDVRKSIMDNFFG